MTSPSSVETVDPTDIDRKTIDTIRCLAIDAVERADSGHPGMPMGAAPMAYVLWNRHLKHNPTNPGWPDRDRFILSPGHGSMLLYALLHLTGYDLPMEELKNFRQWGSKTPGHPENHLTPGVEVTTGPLGQGFANGVGMALAERYLAAQFNTNDLPLVDHHTYGIVSDGDLMEGVSSEAASLAGHQGLGKLIYLYDDNEISIDGDTDLAFTEDVGARFEAYDWHVERVGDGTDLAAIDEAIQSAQVETDRPSLIVVSTHIGHGSPNKQDTAVAHGAPLGSDEVERTKRNLGWSHDEPFHVPDEVYDHMRTAREDGAEQERQWNQLKSTYADRYPERADRFDRFMNDELPDGWEEDLPSFEPGASVSTRDASGDTLDAMAPATDGYLVGGSADLTGSNRTDVEGRSPHRKDRPDGAYFHFGVREHAMAGAANGMTLHGGVRPYVGTFLIFTDYLRPSLRLAGLSELPVTFVMTHDSIGLGEDGPTHQPVEHLSMLRSTPNVTVIRPADGPEVVESWRAALRRKEGPTVLVFTRQGVPVLDRTQFSSAEGLHRGAYVLSDDDGTPDIILMGTGSEVQHTVRAAETLRQDDDVNVRVVSMPSWELFEAQSESYRREVLPPDVTARVAVEAGATLGWERYVGNEGVTVGIDRFGASAPGETNMEKFGFTSENVVRAARQTLE
jgi:transketolase